MMIQRNASERGSALLLVVIVTLILVGISGAYMSFSYINTRKTEKDVSAVQALYIAESAASMYIHGLNYPVPALKAGDPPPRPVEVATPVKFAGGSYRIPKATLVEFGYNGVDDDKVNGVDDDAEKGFVKFQVEGTYAGVTRKLEILINREMGGVFWNAVFAGNVDTKGISDPKYTLSLTGGTNPDRVIGDIYSGGNVSITGKAQMLNESGLAGSSNTVTYQLSNTSDVVGPDYKQDKQDPLGITRNGGKTPWEELAFNNRGLTEFRAGSGDVAYVDVKYQLDTYGAPGTFGSTSAQKQINTISNPAHIFRKNPTMNDGSTNRTQGYEYTYSAKDDFYVEDPTAGSYNTNTMKNAVNGDYSSTAINISPTGNNAVYFVDGNLRVSAESAKSFQLVRPTGAGDLQMTYVVKGNVSFTDNLLYPDWQSTRDALAIIAVEDPSFPNSKASNFDVPSSSLSSTKLPNGMTIDAWINDYNTRTQPARDAGKIVPAFDKTKWGDPKELERASQEYNKSYGSGNVFFGDPGSGTVEHFESFLYAENNFYATNLNSTTASGGTQKVEIYGNMTAGNQVKIVRDTTTGYVPLGVTLDTKIKSPSGTKPPALPKTPGKDSGIWQISTWKMVP